MNRYGPLTSSYMYINHLSTHSEINTMDYTNNLPHPGAIDPG